MNSLTLQQIARALGGEVHGDHVLAPGPGHSAKDRSLSIKLTPDGDFIVNSFASDDWTACKDYVRQKVGGPEWNERAQPDYDHLAAMNARQRAHINGHPHPDGEPPKQSKRFYDAHITSKGYHLEKAYDYTTEDGELLYQVLRYEHPTEEKEFSQRRPDGNGGWFGNAGDRKVIYRWPDIKRHPHNTMFVCEGEKDADRLASLGFLATTVASGVWSQEAIEALKGYDCLILEDNDGPGRKRARVSAEVLYGIAESVRIVSLPGLSDKQDVSDWLDAGSDHNGLVELCKSFPIWEPEKKGSDNTSSENENANDDGFNQTSSQGQSGPIGLDIINAGTDDWNVSPREWLLSTVFCRENVSSILADGGVGKTSLRYAQYLSVATKRQLTGEHVFQRCRVPIVSLEDSTDELRRRMKAACIHHGIPQSELSGWLFYIALGASGGKLMVQDPKGRPVVGPLAADIEKTVIDNRIDLVALDPFVKTHSVEENNNSVIDDVAQILSNLASKHKIAVDVPHHISKGAAEPGNANRGRGASAAKDAFRLVYTLFPMTTEEADALGVTDEAERRALIRMDSGKVNIAPPMYEAKWFRLVGVLLGNCTKTYPNGDNVQTVEPWKPANAFDNMSNAVLNSILDDIAAGMPDGQRYSSHHNAKSRAAWKVIVKHMPDKVPGQAKVIIKSWVKSGLLIEEEYHDEDRREDAKGLRVDDSKRPGTTL